GKAEKPTPPAPTPLAPAPAPAAPGPKPKPTERNFGGSRVIMVDRYALDVQKCSKNRALKKDMIELALVEHKHFWDTKDRRGKLMTHTEFACGHKHAMLYTKDENGEPEIASVKCGPPLQEVQTKTSSGRRMSKLVPVNFGPNPDKADGEDIKDEHVHAVVYVKSEKMEIKI
ncbi:MAG: hypothetical protein V4498_07855, partial [candidate division FCPU426 bacterium]